MQKYMSEDFQKMSEAEVEERAEGYVAFMAENSENVALKDAFFNSHEELSAARKQAFYQFIKPRFVITPR